MTSLILFAYFWKKKFLLPKGGRKEDGVACIMIPWNYGGLY